MWFWPGAPQWVEAHLNKAVRAAQHAYESADAAGKAYVDDCTVRAASEVAGEDWGNPTGSATRRAGARAGHALVFIQGILEMETGADAVALA